MTCAFLSVCLYLPIDRSACRSPSCVWFPHSCLFHFEGFIHPESFCLRCLICICFVFQFLFMSPPTPALCETPCGPQSGFDHSQMKAMGGGAGGGGGPESPRFQPPFSVFFHLEILYSRHFPNYLRISPKKRPQCEFHKQKSLFTWPYHHLSPISRSNENLSSMNCYRQDLSQHDNILSNEAFRHFITRLTYLPFALVHCQT